jgi:hypothetical protein
LIFSILRTFVFSFLFSYIFINLLEIQWERIMLLSLLIFSILLLRHPVIPTPQCSDIPFVLTPDVSTLTWNEIRTSLRDRPFNLQGGGYGFLFRSEYFFRTTRELEYLFFFQNLTLGYVTKNLHAVFPAKLFSIVELNCRFIVSWQYFKCISQ